MMDLEECFGVAQPLAVVNGPRSLHTLSCKIAALKQASSAHLRKAGKALPKLIADGDSGSLHSHAHGKRRLLLNGNGKQYAVLAPGEPQLHLFHDGKQALGSVKTGIW